MDHKKSKKSTYSLLWLVDAGETVGFCPLGDVYIQTKATGQGKESAV